MRKTSKGSLWFLCLAITVSEEIASAADHQALNQLGPSSTLATASPAECGNAPGGPAITTRELDDRVQEIRRADYPELSRATVQVTEFESDDSFLQAQPARRSLFDDPSERIYEIQVNPRLLECPPTSEALNAILHHEFEHLVEYTEWSGTRIIAHGLRYLVSESFRIDYERATDLKTLKKGFASGLIDYRNWLYPRLTPSQLEVKRRTYYTPEEISQWLKDRAPGSVSRTRK